MTRINKSIGRKQLDEKNKVISRKRGRPCKRAIREDNRQDRSSKKSRSSKQTLENKGKAICQKYLDKYHWGQKKRLNRKLPEFPKAASNIFVDAVYCTQVENGPLKAISSMFSKCQLLWDNLRMPDKDIFSKLALIGRNRFRTQFRKFE